MEDDLFLNLNFSEQGGSLSHPKVGWRERKRQVGALLLQLWGLSYLQLIKQAPLPWLSFAAR